MGVIKTFDYGRTPPILRSSEESLISSLGESVLSTPPSEIEERPQLNQERRCPYSNLRRRDPALLIQRLELLSRKRKGARKARRENNALALNTLAEHEDETSSIPKIEDFKPKSKSPLTTLFTDADSKRIWENFLEQSEEEQKKYLDNIENKRNGDDAYYNLDIFQIMMRLEDDEPEAISEYVSLTPAQRFSRLHGGLRNVLKLKKMPNVILINLEKDLTEAFTKDEEAVYTSQKLNSYERLLLHGLSHYHLLKSWSINVDGGRCVKVENDRKLFSKTTTQLSDFLEQRKRQPVHN